MKKQKRLETCIGNSSLFLQGFIHGEKNGRRSRSPLMGSWADSSRRFLTYWQHGAARSADLSDRRESRVA